MNLKYILWLPLFLSIGQLGVGYSKGKVKPLQNLSPKQDDIITVSYCNLVKNPVRYAGKLVRVKAIVLTWLDGASLYDAGCVKEGLEPVLDCGDEECSVMRKMLDKETDYDGDVGRVEAVLIGRLVMPLDASTKSRSKFIIKRIDQATRISRDVPWPSERH